MNTAANDIIKESSGYDLDDYDLEDEEITAGGGKDDITRPVRNLKWYPFTENDKKFIYLKLEDYPTFTLGHFLDAFKRYGKGKAATCIKSRREDCELDKAGCRFGSANPFESPEYIIFGGEKHEIKETYTREGDEFFIPLELNNYLLAHNNNTLRFEYSDNSVTISIARGTESLSHKNATVRRGGRRSKKQTHKKRKHKKQTHKKRKHTKKAYNYGKLK
jgi:hypothetical protein